MSLVLYGKTAGVIGAKGIGTAVAQTLAKAGAAVIVTYTSERDEMEKLIASFPAAAYPHGAVQVDLRERSSVAELFSKAERDAAGLDILIVCGSATVLDKPLSDVTDEEFEKVMSLNVRGTFFALREAATRLRDGGRIVVFSTPYTVQPQVRRGVTGASKAASDGLALALAKELGPRQITVNAVMPGPTDTESFHKAVSKEQEAQLLQMMPLGRIGSAEDIANVIGFLCSPDGQWITGQTIRATGGLL